MGVRGPRAQRRLGIEHLEQFLLGCDIEIQQFNSQPNSEHRVMAGALAHRIGRPVGTVHRWRREGIPFFTADQIAIHLDAHPAIIWPDYHPEEQLCHT